MATIQELQQQVTQRQQALAQQRQQIEAQNLNQFSQRDLRQNLKLPGQLGRDSPLLKLQKRKGEIERREQERQRALGQLSQQEQELSQVQGQINTVQDAYKTLETQISRNLRDNPTAISGRRLSAAKEAFAKAGLDPREAEKIFKENAVISGTQYIRADDGTFLGSAEIGRAGGLNLAEGISFDDGSFYKEFSIPAQIEAPEIQKQVQFLQPSQRESKPFGFKENLFSIGKEALGGGFVGGLKDIGRDVKVNVGKSADYGFISGLKSSATSTGSPIGAVGTGAVKGVQAIKRFDEGFTNFLDPSGSIRKSNTQEFEARFNQIQEGLSRGFITQSEASRRLSQAQKDLSL